MNNAWNKCSFLVLQFRVFVGAGGWHFGGSWSTSSGILQRIKAGTLPDPHSAWGITQTQNMETVWICKTGFLHRPTNQPQTIGSSSLRACSDPVTHFCGRVCVCVSEGAGVTPHRFPSSDIKGKRVGQWRNPAHKSKSRFQLWINHKKQPF